jgi:DNA-binding CsgD family transcriptional regulator
MGTVVGRDRELEEIAAFLDLAGGEPRALLIEGEAGIGKTTLWRAAVHEARERGYRVLACAGAESETQLSLTALRDLIGDVFEEVAHELPSPQQRAMAVILLREEPTDPPAGTDTIAVAFLATLRALAANARTVLAIDDVQWLDPSSSGVVEYALRRLRNEQLSVLMARRLGDQGESPQLGLERALGDQLRRLRVEGLSLGALHRILRSRLGLSLSRPTLRRVHEACGGNPFFAFEIGAALRERGQPLEPAAPLPIPKNLHELLRRRVDGVSPGAREALLAAAATANPEIAVVEAASSSPGVEDAIAAGIVVPDGKRLIFTHPLLGEAVYLRATPRRLRETHGRLAGVLRDPLERALHLALASEGPDGEVAEALDRAAALARARGAPADAARLLQEAARVTPAEDNDRAVRRALAAADSWVDAGDQRQSAALAAPLVERLPAGGLHADALMALGRTVADRVEAASLFDRALAESGDDPVRRMEALFRACYARLHTMDLPVVRATAREALAAAEEAGNAGRLVLALSIVGWIETWMAGESLGTDFLRRARQLEAESGFVDFYDAPGMWLGWWHLAGDELDEARPLLEEQYRRASEAGDEYSRLWLSYPLTELECRAGDYTAARLYAELGYELAEEIESPYPLTALHYARALVAAHTGDADAANAEAAASRLAAREINSRLFELRHGVVLGLLAAAQGMYEEARSELEPLYALRDEAGIDPDHFYSFWPELVEALIAADELERAEAIVAEREQHESGLDRPGKRALAARCRGLIAGARGSLEEAMDLLQEALRLHELRPVPLEHGRTLLALGTHQRRARKRRAARESLQASLSLFQKLGAELWAERARAELARIGGRAPASGDLTPSERRIAELVAAGKTNREVAALLVIADRTVESALTQIYRKLDVRSRTELARLLAAAD